MATSDAPDPDEVVTSADLAEAVDQLRVRAAAGSGKVRLSVRDIARATEIPRSTLAGYLSGTTVVPPDLLRRIVVALGVSAEKAPAWVRAAQRIAARNDHRLPTGVVESRERPVAGTIEKAPIRQFGQPVNSSPVPGTAPDCPRPRANRDKRPHHTRLPLVASFVVLLALFAAAITGVVQTWLDVHGDRPNAGSGVHPEAPRTGRPAGTPPRRCQYLTTTFGSTCYEWPTNDQWISDRRDDDWWVGVELETEYDKSRRCENRAGSGPWRRCTFDHRQAYCVRFRLYERNSPSGRIRNLSEWSPWYRINSKDRCREPTSRSPAT